MASGGDPRETSAAGRAESTTNAIGWGATAVASATGCRVMMSPPALGAGRTLEL